MALAFGSGRGARPQDKSPRLGVGDAALFASLAFLVMAAPAYSFLRVQVQTRKRGHHALAAVAYRFALDVEAEDGRAWRYARRGGVGAPGAALPAGASDDWTDVEFWAKAIERVERRRDSRLMRDDIVAIPLALIESGEANEALGEYAQELAHLHRTPVHFVLHPPRLGSLNWHSHVIYAGRRLTEDGMEFAAKRDRSQDNEELIDQHKAIWTGVCRRRGIELDFDGPRSERPLGHLGPRAAGVEREAMEAATARAMGGAIMKVGGQVDELRDLAIAVREEHIGETVSEMLARERAPVTRAARRAKHRPVSRRAWRAAAQTLLADWTAPTLDPNDFPEPAPRTREIRSQDPIETETDPEPAPPPPEPAPADSHREPPTEEEMAHALAWISGRPEVRRPALQDEQRRIGIEHLSGKKVWSESGIRTELEARPPRDRRHDDWSEEGLDTYSIGPVRSPYGAAAAARELWRQIKSTAERHFGAGETGPPRAALAPAEDIGSWSALTPRGHRRQREKAESERGARISNALEDWNAGQVDFWQRLLEAVLPHEVNYWRARREEAREKKQRERDAEAPESRKSPPVNRRRGTGFGE